MRSGEFAIKAPTMTSPNKSGRRKSGAPKGGRGAASEEEVDLVLEERPKSSRERFDRLQISYTINWEGRFKEQGKGKDGKGRDQEGEGKQVYAIV